MSSGRSLKKSLSSVINELSQASSKYLGTQPSAGPNSDFISALVVPVRKFLSRVQRDIEKITYFAPYDNSAIRRLPLVKPLATLSRPASLTVGDSRYPIS